MVRLEAPRWQEVVCSHRRRMARTTLEHLRQRKKQAEEELQRLGRNSHGHQRATLHDDPALEERKNVLRSIIVNIGNLDRVRIIEPRKRTGRVGVGNKVILEFNGDNMAAYTLLGDDDAKHSGRPNVISYKSPIGSAVLGKRRGENATANIPGKEKIKVRVCKIEPGDF